MSDMTPNSECPDAATLRALLDGTLASERQAATQAHVDRCPTCEAALRQMTAGGESWIGMAEKLKSETTDDPKLAAALERLKADDGSGGESNTPADDPQQTLDFLQPADDPKLLGKLGQHEISEVVGWGGMGVVLKAYDPSLHRVVAVKVLASHLAHHAVARKRFIREAQAAAAVCHDNVVTIHAIDTGLGEPEGVSPRTSGVNAVRGLTPSGSPTNQALPKIIMQFVAGGSLQERIDQDGPLELKEILRIAMQTAAGLAAAHAQGVVHRDVKPANILLENGVQRVKLTDFGLARVMDDASLTLSGVIAGTPQYMAPEQAWGRDVDARADLFSLGAVMYAMCTGHSPFRARTTMAVLKRVCEDAPRPLRAINPDVPEWLVAIVEKLLAKKPEDRFQSATEVSELLAKWLAHVQQPNVVPAPKLVIPTSDGARRHGTSNAPPQGGTTNPDALLTLDQFQRRPRELRSRMSLVTRWVPFVVLGGVVGVLLMLKFLPSPAEWTSSETISFGIIGSVGIGVILFLVAAFVRWLFDSGENEVAQSDHVSPEGRTTSATISSLSPKIIVIALVVTGILLAFLSISVIEASPQNLGGFLAFSLVQLLASFAMAAAFRAAWNTSRWMTWIAVLLFLPFVASNFGYLVSYRDASAAMQFVGCLQILTALVYEFALLFVRPLFLSGGLPPTTVRPGFWRWMAALLAVPLVVLPSLYLARMRLSVAPVHRDPPVVLPGPSIDNNKAAQNLPLHQQSPPSAKLLSNKSEPEPSIDGIDIRVPFDPSVPVDGFNFSIGFEDRKPPVSAPLQGRWVVLTLQGDEPPMTMASAGGMGMPGGTMASSPSNAVTPVRMDQLRSLEFRDQSLFWNDSEQAKLRVSIRKDHVLSLTTNGGDFVRHGIFTVEGDRLVICWGPSNQPLPRGFQPSGHEQLLVCRREWSRPREVDSQGNSAVEKFHKDSKLPRAEMPFSSREAAELQSAWAEKTDSPVEVTNTIGLKLRVIPPGSFGNPVATLAESKVGFGGGFASDMAGGSMGSPRSGERGYATKGPILVGAHEVTVAQFRQFVEDSKYVTESERDVPADSPKPPSWRTPDIEQGSDQHPVVNVTFDDALAFCHWLSLKEKKPYRLLTRREWEFCARAGSWLPVTLGPGKLAYRSQFFTTTAPVGSYSANSFGLHDFIGNVAEWAWQDDIPTDDPRRKPVPNQAIFDTDPGVFCGGDFRQHINRSQPHEWLHPQSTAAKPAIGFRVVCDLTAESLVSFPKGWPPMHQLFASQEIVRLRHLPSSAPANDPNAKADETKPRDQLRHVVWLELMTQPGSLPYSVEWQDFEVQRRPVREGELSDEGRLRAVLISDDEWKPVPLDDALRLLEQTDFAPDNIPHELTDPVLTMPLIKLVEGRWRSGQHRWTKPGLGGAFPIRESDAELPEFQRPRLLRFLDFHAPNGEYFYRVRLKYRIPHLAPETIHSTEWFVDEEPVSIDVDVLDGRKPLENLPTIELKPVAKPDPNTALTTQPVSPKLRRWKKSLTE